MLEGLIIIGYFQGDSLQQEGFRLSGITMSADMPLQIHL